MADDEALSGTIKALNENGISTFVVASGEEAKRKALELIPKGSEVFTFTSTTLEEIGLAKELNESGKYNSLRSKFQKMDRNTQKKEMAQLAAAPDWAVGSVHAVTQDGKVIIASATGSQLAAYANGAQHILWIVGTQKIVKDVSSGVKRINEYALPLETERAKKAYGVGSFVAKLLILNKEFVPNRITLIFVREKLGF